MVGVVCASCTLCVGSAFQAVEKHEKRVETHMSLIYSEHPKGDPRQCPP